jgi:hypothetical protein
VDPNPKVLAGPQSEKSSSSNSDPEMNRIPKNERLNREQNVSFFYSKTFSVLQIPEYRYI